MSHANYRYHLYVYKPYSAMILRWLVENYICGQYIQG